MSLLNGLFSLSLQSWLVLLVTIVVVAHVVPYFADPHAIRAYPGPFLAKFTDLWLGRVATQGHRSEVVHELHRQYGERFPRRSSAFVPRRAWLCLAMGCASRPIRAQKLEGIGVCLPRPWLHSQWSQCEAPLTPVTSVTTTLLLMVDSDLCEISAFRCFHCLALLPVSVAIFQHSQRHACGSVASR